MMTQLEIERTERLIESNNRLAQALETLADPAFLEANNRLAKALETFSNIDGALRLAMALENAQGLAASMLRLADVLRKFEAPPPGWRRIVEDFQRAVNQMPRWAQRMHF